MKLLLEGKKLRDIRQEALARLVGRYTESPVLAILQVGDRPDSTAYINQKKKFGQAIGVKILHKKYPASVSEAKILSDIEKYNKNKKVHGIIVQIPVPAHINQGKVIDAIAPYKDVDGLTTENIRKLFTGDRTGHVQATARGIVALLSFYKIKIKGEHVVVVGRSNLIGKPTALALLNKDATVTIAHKETKNLAAITRSADILIIAIGDPEFITKKHISKGQIVIDVGINRKGGKMLGDVKQSDAQSIVKALSPVPGGVGPMTVVSLFENVLDAYKISKGLYKNKK
jgi:methylenetetrahydrofolate dehydrogenase (NADP+)/methenyltetrahydrofolate cyclohydrolase